MFGNVKVEYTNSQRPGIVEQDTLEVCPREVRRTIVVHLVNFAGSGVTDASIETQMVPVAREIWASACVDLKFDTTMVASVPNPGPRLLNPLVMPNRVFARSGVRPTVLFSQLSDDLKLAMERGVPDRLERERRTKDGEITVYFVSAFRSFSTSPSLNDGPGACSQPISANPPEADKRPNTTDVGFAFSGTTHVKDYCQPQSGLQTEQEQYLASAFMSGALVANLTGSVGKILAHEIGHLVLNSTNAAAHEPEIVNLLKEGYSPEALLEKRLKDSQLSDLRSCQNSFTNRSAINCHP